MRPARARKTGRLQQAEGGLICCARSRKAPGKKGVAIDPDGRRVRCDRGYGDGEAASPEEALIGNQSRPQHCAENCWRFRCRCSRAIVEGIEQVELTGRPARLLVASGQHGRRALPSDLTDVIVQIALCPPQ